MEQNQECCLICGTEDKRDLEYIWDTGKYICGPCWRVFQALSIAFRDTQSAGIAQSSRPLWRTEKEENVTREGGEG